jgi:hypothetical protein
MQNSAVPAAEICPKSTPEIQRHHWARNDQDFAIRLEADDLPGMLRKGITIEPGLNALLIERVVTRGTIPAVRIYWNARSKNCGIG